MARLTSTQRAIVERCRNDPIFFIDNFMKVKHPKAGLLPFKTWGYQQRIVKATRKHRFNITQKPRQAGVSKIAGALCLHTGLFSTHAKVLIVSRKDDDAMDFLSDNVKIPFFNLPEWMQAIWGEPKNNEHELEFKSNGSQIRSLTSNPNVLRSHASTFNVIDEAAHIQGMGNLWASGWSTLQHGGRVLAISTTNGIGDWFWATCTEAEAGINVFNLIKIDWTEMTWAIEFKDNITNKMVRIAPTDGIRKCVTKEEIEKYGEYWSPWLEEQYKGLVEKGEPWKFEQEVLARFVGSGRTIIDKMAIANAKLNIVDEYEKVTSNATVFYIRGNQEEEFSFDIDEPKQGLYIWEHPPEGDGVSNYVIGVDFATGKGNDYHGLQVLNSDTRSQAAELMIRNKPHEFLRMLVWLAIYYKMALIVPERNNGGDPLIDNLLYDWGYTNIWREIKPNTNPRSKNKEVSYGKHGFFTSETSKATIVRALNQNITADENTFKVYSRRLIEQFEIFIRRKDKSGRDTGQIGAEAGPGNFDDLVMAFGLGLIGCRDAMPIDKEIMQIWRSDRLPSQSAIGVINKPNNGQSMRTQISKLSDLTKSYLPALVGEQSNDYDPSEDILSSVLKSVGELNVPAVVAPKHRFK